MLTWSIRWLADNGLLPRTRLGSTGQPSSEAKKSVNVFRAQSRVTIASMTRWTVLLQHNWMFNFMASPVALLRFVASYAACGMYYAFAGILTSGRCADNLALPDDRKVQTSLNRGPIRQLIVFLFSQNDPLRVS